MSQLLKRIFRLKTLLIVSTLTGLLSMLFAYLSPYIHPNTLSIIPLFGLGYFFILIYNFVHLVIWVFLKSKWSIVILIMLILGGHLHLRFFSFGADDKNNGNTELTITSYNVRLFDRYNANKSNSLQTRDAIFKYLSEQQSDVVCFQEFYNQGNPSDFITKDTLIKLLNSHDYHERYAERRHKRQTFGIALFSKFPIIEKGFINFPDNPNEFRNFNYCIYADIVKKQDTFRVYNVHFQSFSLDKTDYALFQEENQGVEGTSSSYFKLASKIRKAYPIRAEQAKLVVEHIQKSKYPVIVCGDFNDTPLSYSYNLFSSHLTDAFINTSFGIGSTYAGKIPAGRIDYIFHSPALGSKAFTIQEEQLSDHYAVNCTVFKK